MTAAKSTSDEIASVFERATQGPMRSCMLIYFAHADFEETRMNNEKVHKIYSGLADVQDVDPTLVRAVANFTKSLYFLQTFKSTKYLS